MDTFGQTIRQLREEKKLPLRKVAAHLDIDQAVLSKFEHDNRVPKRELVIQLAEYFKADKKLLLIQWLAGKILAELADEEVAIEALQIATEKMKAKLGSGKKKGNSESVINLKVSEALGKERMLMSDNLPPYIDVAKTLFAAVTREKFNEQAINTITGFIGESKAYEVYLFYRPNAEWLKNNALTLNKIKELPDYKGKKRLVFTSLKYVNDDTCKLHHVEFCKLPY